MEDEQELWCEYCGTLLGMNVSEFMAARFEYFAGGQKGVYPTQVCSKCNDIFAKYEG